MAKIKGSHKRGRNAEKCSRYKSQGRRETNAQRKAMRRQREEEKAKISRMVLVGKLQGFGLPVTEIPEFSRGKMRKMLQELEVAG